MSDNRFELIEQYDRLEALLENTPSEAETTKSGELAGELAVIRLLERDAAAPTQMPEAERFRAELRRRLNPAPARGPWLGVGLTLAAAVVAALIFWTRPSETGIEPQPLLDERALAMVAREDIRNSMVDYLEEAEQLLRAIRDYETSCDLDQADLTHERQLANNLLLRQKQFWNEMKKPQYYQAQNLFTQLETILVDLNGLEPCTDATELELLNEHIDEKRILSKVRIIAQDIELS